MKEIEITLDMSCLKMISLLAILFVVLVSELRITFGTPINFGDEGYHATIIQQLANKKEIPTWVPRISNDLNNYGYFSGILFHLVSAGFMPFGFNDAILRFVVPLTAVLCGFVVFVLVKKLYNENVGWLSAILFVTFPSFVTYSVLFYRDALLTFFMTAFFLTFILAFKEQNKKYFFLSAVLAFLTIMSKTVGFTILFFIGAVFLYEIFTRKKFLETFKKYALWIAIVLLLIFPFYLRNIAYYKRVCYLPSSYGLFEKIPILSFDGCNIDNYQDKYEFAGRVEQVGTEASVYSIGLTSYLNFAYGNLFIVFLSFFTGLIVLLSNKREIDLLLILALLSAIPIFYISTGRSEDTARYTLGWSPLVAIICSVWLDKLSESMNKNLKYLGLIVFVFIAIYSIFGLKFLRIDGYGLLDRLSVLNSVKQFSPTFFEACDWVKANLPEDSRLMTIWVYRAIYNCQRDGSGNLADISLSKDVETIKEAAKANNITHIFIQKFSIDLQNKHYLENYDLDFVRFLENHPETFVKVYENGQTLQECQNYWLRGYPCDGNIIYEIKF